MVSKGTQIKQGTPEGIFRTLQPRRSLTIILVLNFRTNAPTIAPHTKHTPTRTLYTKQHTHDDDRTPRARLECLRTTVRRRLDAVAGPLEQEGDDMVAPGSRMYLCRVGRAREQQEVPWGHATLLCTHNKDWTAETYDSCGTAVLNCRQHQNYKSTTLYTQR